MLVCTRPRRHRRRPYTRRCIRRVLGERYVCVRACLWEGVCARSRKSRSAAENAGRENREKITAAAAAVAAENTTIPPGVRKSMIGRVRPRSPTVDARTPLPPTPPPPRRGSFQPEFHAHTSARVQSVLPCVRSSVRACRPRLVVIIIAVVNIVNVIIAFCGRPVAFESVVVVVCFAFFFPPSDSFPTIVVRFVPPSVVASDFERTTAKIF